MLNYAIKSYISKACEKMHCECSIITGSENFFNESVTDTKCEFGSHLIFFVDPIKETIQDGISSGKVFMRVVLFFADYVGQQEINDFDGDVFIESIIFLSMGTSLFLFSSITPVPLSLVFILNSE